MIVEVKKSFNKDVAAIKDKKLAQRVKDAIINIENARTVREIHNLKKMEGSDNAYRIRIGDYRICFYLVEHVIQLVIFAHRKEIYRYFP